MRATRSNHAPSAVRNIAQTLLSDRIFSRMITRIRVFLLSLLSFLNLFYCQIQWRKHTFKIAPLKNKYTFFQEIAIIQYMKIYSKPFCPYCQRFLSLLDAKCIKYKLIDITESPDQALFMESLSGSSGVPQVAIENIIIYDYRTEETLIQDIQTILSTNTISPENSDNLTSQFVFLT